MTDLVVVQQPGEPHARPTTHLELPMIDLPDNSFTSEETRLAPGVYLSDPQGHAQLVGTNERRMAVLDLGGVVHVAGIAVHNPDHLDAFADRLHQLAHRLRAFTTRPDAKEAK